MKSLKYLLVAFLVQAAYSSCRKAAPLNPKPNSSVIVFNGIVGSNSIITDFTGLLPVATYYSTTPKIDYGSFFVFSKPSGTTPFVAYQITDTLQAIYSRDFHNTEFDLKPHGIYSLFLCGEATGTSQADAVLVTDSVPYHPASDSSMGIRFINLSAGSNPVNVTLSTSAPASEFSNIAYKSITTFKNYSVNISSPTSYIFQIRDVVTNDVLGTVAMSGIRNGVGTNISPNKYRFKNFTIVLTGKPGGTGSAAQGAFLVNNY